ncbi:hypothetical protein ACO0LV_02275 [Pseudactinotalea sp. Z1739]|uniref:hypothetical protein n=1 Tax=Pseudactinotalea sp. Z1739 TaxID=3413028 RepID=UPI003C7B13DD
MTSHTEPADGDRDAGGPAGPRAQAAEVHDRDPDGAGRAGSERPKDPGARKDPGSPKDSGARKERSDVPPAWLRTSALVTASAVLIILLVAVAAATLPSWWTSTVGRQIDGVSAAGILWGLFYGVVFTLVPMVLILVAIRVRWHWKVRLGVGAGALLLLLPNLLTLAVSLGLSDSTRTARTVLTVQAPNFGVATLIGVLTTLLLGGGAALFIYRMGASRRELRELRKQAGHD